MDYVVTKYVEGEAAELHFIKMPETCAKGWYIAGISVGAFRHRMQKRHIEVFKTEDGKGSYARAFACDFYYRTDMQIDFDNDVRIWGRAIPNYLEGVPRIQHDSLWAFYDHIGYDHKRNKLKVEPVRLK